MKKTLEAFLQDGIRRYPEAKATVAFFEDQVKSLLTRTLKARLDWKPLHKKEIKTPTVTRTGGVGWYFACAITGETVSKKKVHVDCGLWWGSPAGSEGVVYASFYDKPEDLLLFTAPDPAKGISSFAGWDRTFLWLPIPGDFRIDPPLNRLIDILLKELR